MASKQARRSGLTDLAIHRVLIGSHRVADYLNAACERAGVSLPIARAVQVIAEGEPPVTPMQVSRGVGRGPAAISDVLKRLLNAGYITVDVDPQDRRSFHLKLTRKGRTKWDAVGAELAAAETLITVRYGKQRLAELADAMGDLVSKLGVGAD